MKDSMHMQDTFFKLPKIDLHCHLDGSLTVNHVKNVLNSELPDEVLENKLMAPFDCSGLTQYLTCFDLPIQCLQTPDNITAGVLDLIARAAAENVSYIEIRFAPFFSLNPNQNYSQIYEAAINGCRRGYETYGVHSNIILCAMRNLDYTTNLTMLKSCLDYVGHGICAIDLAGDESKYSNNLFIDFFKEASRYNVPFTIHSGECGSVENVKLALEMGAKRVGHGISLMKDKNLMDMCRQKRLGLELCPISNYQTGALKPDEFYPLKSFLDHGLCATINTDNRTVSRTSLTKEYLFVYDKYNVCEEDFVTLYKNSVEMSFADDNIKHELINKIH